METIYEQLQKAGIPVDVKGTVVYALVTSKSREIIDRYKLKNEVDVVLNKNDHQTWFKIPLLFSPKPGDRKLNHQIEEFLSSLKW